MTQREDAPRDESIDDIGEKIEEQLEDMQPGIVAADATGMVSSEIRIMEVELREGEVTPPV